MKSLQATLNRLERDIEQTMKKEVAKDMKEKHKAAVEEKVYKPYQPKSYKRREDMGKDENISIEATGMSVRLTNTTMGQDDPSLAIAAVVETGEGYDYWEDAFPRPFIAETGDVIEQEGSHVKALKEGLTKRGWTVK